MIELFFLNLESSWKFGIPDFNHMGKWCKTLETCGRLHSPKTLIYLDHPVRSPSSMMDTHYSHGEESLCPLSLDLGSGGQGGL